MVGSGLKQIVVWLVCNLLSVDTLFVNRMYRHALIVIARVFLHNNNYNALACSCDLLECGDYYI